jgi:hypothetical protein
VFSRFWHVRRRAPSPPRAPPAAVFAAVDYDENLASDQDNDFDDIPGFVLDEDAEGQDALADFDVGATFAPNYGHDGHDCRKEGDREHADHDFLPTLRNWEHDTDTATAAHWFFHFFPIQFLSTDVLNATNAQDPALNLTLPLLMNYLTARLIISCHVGLPLDTFWGLQSASAFRKVPYLGDIISANYFKQVNTAFRMHIPDPLAPPDRFSEVRGMWAAINRHWQQYGITPSFLCCNDESMASFISRYCPGFTKVDRKPRPFGNLLHCGACALTKIIYILELQEGKDRPQHLPVAEFSHLFPDGNKAGPLMMRLCKPLFGTGSIVIHDAGFSSIPALAQLKKRGVFASCLIKKKKYWPKFTLGGEHEAHMAARPIGDIDARQAQFAGEQYTIYLQKDSTYTLQLAANYGKNVRSGPTKKRRHPETGQLHAFQYSEPIAHYYRGRHAADDNNHFRQGIASIEDGWQTKKYHQRMFAVAMGMCETNAKLAHDYFGRPKPGPKLTTVQFRQQLIDDLLRLYPTPEFSSPQKKQRTSADLDLALSGHRHVTKPLHAGDFVGRGPGLIEGFRRCKKPYQQQACQGARCGKACRTYCSCDPSVPLCATCYALHLRTSCRVN